MATQVRFSYTVREALTIAAGCAHVGLLSQDPSPPQAVRTLPTHPSLAFDAVDFNGTGEYSFRPWSGRLSALVSADVKCLSTLEGLFKRF